MTAEQIIRLYRSLIRIRKVEQKIEELYPRDEMKTPVHLSLGQEAVSVGVCSHLKREDYVFSNHRSHGHYLAKGGDLPAMIAELYCKETGCAAGRGGSMHLVDPQVGLMGSSAIVAGSIPHAVGAAFASWYRGDNRVAVTFFGDAAMEEGVFFESLNLAALRKLPVVFVCENNYYAVCSRLSARQVNERLTARAGAFDIPAYQADGSDLLSVYEQAGTAIAAARSGQGPVFLECLCQRWRGHNGIGDPGRENYRRSEDLDDAFRRCPVEIFKNKILAQNLAPEADIAAIDEAVDGEIEAAFLFAQQSPLPKKEELGRFLFE
ncbi:MAG: thiamine pyrophosphate-dependent dehydrogenase E1 component subunit alpha [Candidatus Omnitrophica bacterium]|nr:thiamine pyrophosphate-dependent dehydrogenase E1 component subunit alpha [Candidatus Omnitrophota bacterium]